jgi:hypothetical protein
MHTSRDLAKLTDTSTSIGTLRATLIGALTGGRVERRDAEIDEGGESCGPPSHMLTAIGLRSTMPLVVNIPNHSDGASSSSPNLWAMIWRAGSLKGTILGPLSLSERRSSRGGTRTVHAMGVRTEGDKELRDLLPCLLLTMLNVKMAGHWAAAPRYTTFSSGRSLGRTPTARPFLSS